MSEKEIQPFSELEAKHWGGEEYYSDPLLKFIYTAGVKDFIATYGAAWLISDMMLNEKIRKAKSQVYPCLVVDKEHIAHIFLDCDHAELGKNKPLFSEEDLLKLLPEGKLNFEFSPYEQILILMSEH